jgi:hypothetical protein
MPATLDTSRSAHVPTSRALLPDGTHLVANGLDLARRYDGFTIENAGLPAVTHGSFSGAGSGAGSINGKYYFAVQYEDDEGYQGNLSSLLSFTAASDDTVTYSNVPVSGDSRVAKRRIYRGRQSRVLYLDATISDNVTTSTTSTKTNTQLVLQTTLSILNPDGTANARRFGRPPNFMQQVVYHQDRTFWLLPLRYSEGMAQVTASSQSVNIIGGTVKNSMVGRRFAVEGVATEYIVTAASPSASTIRLSVNYAGSTNAFAKYAVYPPRENFNGVYPSYGGEPESVNAADRINVDSDLTNEEDLTGGFRFGSFLYLATASNLFKWSFRTDPALGSIDPQVPRGLIWWRCAARAEGFVYLIDRHGPYRFNGGLDDSIGAGVEDYFQDKIVWDQHKWFHATANETEGAVRFFVCLDGSFYPKHALCYSYTTGQWWEETYPWEIAASTTVPAPIARKLICGTTQARVLVMDSPTDGTTKKITSRYSVSSASVLRLTVSSADWQDSDLLNAPVEIVEGTGIKQQRRILQADKATGRLWVDRPFLTKPDNTSVVQVGGIHYTLVTKTFTNGDKGDGQIRLQVDATQNEQTMDLALYEAQMQTATTSAITRSFPAGPAWTKGSEWGRTRLKKARTGSNWDGVVEASFAAPVSGRSPAHSRHTQIALDGCANQEPVVIHSAELSGVE